MVVDVIIPALDEERAVGGVVASIDRRLVRDVIVVDNGSRDATAARAAEAGLRVIHEPRRGYGQACLAGTASLRAGCDVVAYLDADGSDEPADLRLILEPILAGRADLVVGARRPVDLGALTPQQRVGNAVAALWLRRRYGLAATDLGPFRAIRLEALARLGMSDRTYGWTVEMQIRAARAGLRYVEREVSYRRRVGVSKISGTLRGTLGASVKILSLLAWHDVLKPGAPR
jgi:glycosyltransferase involved in cell wall biosynthesis